MASNHNHTLHLRRPNGSGAPRHAPPPPPPASAPSAPQPGLQAAPGALATYSGFVGVTAPLTLAGGFYMIDFTAVSASSDLFVEGQDLKNNWSSIRCLNVTHHASVSGLPLAAPSTTIRFNNQSLAVASITISLTGP
jgi:hypothetical protein